MSIPLPTQDTGRESPPRRLTAALVGNPNTGKTTLFNALSGLRQRTGNYAGVTVETKRGQANFAGQVVDLIDLPGTYSLAARSPDEMVAVDVILGRQAGESRPDVVVSIVDASNLDRNLYLTTQVLELGVPVIIALNMVDVAANQGLRVDVEHLGKILGVPVVPIQANQGKGLDHLREVIATTASRSRSGPDSPGQGAVEGLSRRPIFPPAFENEVTALQGLLGNEPTFLARRLLFDVGGFTEQRLVEQKGPDVARQIAEARARLATAGCAVPAVEARVRYGWIRQVSALCVTKPAVRMASWTDRLDRVLTNRVWGTLIFLAVMLVVFVSIFWLAKWPMKLIDGGKDRLMETLRDHLPSGMFSSLLVDGILQGVGSVLVFLPQIVILFGFLAVLEDCGYMARAAFLMDRLMARCGLSGKSFIPLLSSVACAVPGILATRVIENRRDRLATIMVAPLMSCSARLPLYILLVGAFLTDGYAFWVPGVVMFCLYMLGFLLAPLVALALKQTILRGATPLFIMEMPLYKRPSLTTVLLRMSDATGAFLKRAGTFILASMVLVWALLYFPRGGLADALRAQAAEARQAAAAEGIDEKKKEESTEKANELDAESAKVKRDGLDFDTYLAPLRRNLRAQKEKYEEEKAAGKSENDLKELKEKNDELEDRINALVGIWKRQSVLGRAGKAIEPVVRPLGWDWRIGVAALASFPAREVVVGTLGILYNKGQTDSEDSAELQELGATLKDAEWDDQPGHKVFTVPTALSLLVFFALCCQCASTLAVIRRETRSWGWPIFTFVYMTALAYVGALLVFQIGSRLF